MSEQGNAAPGWYPDGQGGQRYWDGSQWTEHSRGNQQTAVATKAPEEKWWFNPIVIGVLCLFCFPVGLILVWLHPSWPTKTKGIVTGVVAALVVVAMISSAVSEEPTTETADLTSEESTPEPKAEEPTEEAPAQKKEEPKAEAPIVVGAAQLIKEFEENELAADEKYKGKRLQVSGVVEKVDTEPFDSSDYILLINGGGDYEFLSVTCYDIPNEKLSSLSPGQNVTMVGDFKDGGDLGVDLNHCSLK